MDLMKTTNSALAIFAVVMGALATQSCESTDSTYHNGSHVGYQDGRYAQDNGYYHERAYTHEDTGYTHENTYPSDRPSIDLHF
jgi:hypothetical protein